MANKEIFDRIATSYDSEEGMAVNGHIVNQLKESMEQLDCRGTLIDFGCGTGEIGLHFVDEFAEVLFADVSPNMLAVVEAKFKSLQVKNARTLLLEESDIVATQADCVIVARVLLHIPDVETTLKNLFQMLKPGGMLLIVDFDRNEQVRSEIIHNGFEQDELADVLREIGFVEVSAHTFYHKEKLLMNQAASMFVMKAKKI